MEKKLRVGIFGLSRGRYFIPMVNDMNAVVTAICDGNPKSLEEAKKMLPDGQEVGMFTDFDEFIQADFDVVILVNYFCDHAKFAIKSMRAGKHVLSETLPNVTMAEGVALCRTKEETGRIYTLIENYPYNKSTMDMANVYQSGKLGEVVYAEGIYAHPFGPGVSGLIPGEYHWRNWTPRTYYSTHALAPLMTITGAMPKRVMGMASFHPEMVENSSVRAADALGVIMCETDNNAIFRVVGWAQCQPHGTRFLVSGTKGSIQVDEMHFGKIKECYNSWDVPKEEADIVRDAQWPDPALGEKADASLGHGSGDYIVMEKALAAIAAGEEPFMDVYRSTATSSVAILSWRSILNNNIFYDIPDFRKEEDRKLYENDHLSPFPDKNGHVDIPCSSKPYTPSEESMELARKNWGNTGSV